MPMRRYLELIPKAGLIYGRSRTIFCRLKRVHIYNNYRNTKAVELTGYTLKEVLGQFLVSGFIAPEGQEDVRSALNKALDNDHVPTFEFPLLAKDGSQIDILCNATPRYGPKGEVKGGIVLGLRNT